MIDAENAAVPAPGTVPAPAPRRGDDGPSLSVERLAREGGPALEWLVQRPPGPATGAPILFLHGAFAGAWCWAESWLGHVGASGRHAAALSLRGHGGSEGREAVGWVGLAAFFADLTLAIRAMPAPPVVVAHSFGGLLAQHLLGQAATGAVAIRGLVLVGSLPPEGLGLILPWLALSGWTGAGRAARAERDALFGRDPAGAALDAAGLGEAAVTGLTQALIPLPILPAWAAGLPTLVLHGVEDRLIDPGVALRTALYHGGTYEGVAGAGHFPMLGRDAAAGATALCRWLDSRGL